MNNKITAPFLILNTILLLIPVFLSAQLSTSKLFNDHMVLQRGVENPVWGWGNPGEVIMVRIGDQEHLATVSKDGKWKTKLKPMKAGGPHVMYIKANKESKTIQDILIGDVWICSGQSNMEWIVSSSNNAEEEMAKAMDSKIRHFKIPHSYSLQPSDQLEDGNWQVCSPGTVGNFTAVGYFFAKNLRVSENVPIGLINTSWGGSRIEPWMSPESLGYQSAEESSLEIGREMEKKTIMIKESLQGLLGELPATDKGMQNGEAVWAASDLDDQEWQGMELPGLWENQGFKNLDGKVWFRKTVKLTADEASKNAMISLGRIDDAEVTWINGKKVGSSGNYDTERLYKIPRLLLKEGKNVIAVQVEDFGYGGGFWGEPESLYLQLGEEKRNLASTWKYNVGMVNLKTALQANQTPTILYHKMIQPILGCGIKGAIWYQGESNAGSFEHAEKYAELFPKMINDWRQRWNMGDFPFLWVQLANWKATQDNPVESEWAVLRESQTKTLSLKNTGQAVIIDIGEADDIHPRNKQDVGKRLALAAQKIAHGKDLVYSGPVYKSMKVQKKKIRITFDHVGSGLQLKKGTDKLQEFAIAGADGKFMWANARIEGSEVVVWHESIRKPVAVRYAWADNPDKANLYNAEGLPACPFRTDSK